MRRTDEANCRWLCVVTDILRHAGVGSRPSMPTSAGQINAPQADVHWPISAFFRAGDSHDGGLTCVLTKTVENGPVAETQKSIRISFRTAAKFKAAFSGLHSIGIFLRILMRPDGFRRWWIRKFQQPQPQSIRIAVSGTTAIMAARWSLFDVRFQIQT